MQGNTFEMTNKRKEKIMDKTFKQILKLDNVQNSAGAVPMAAGFSSPKNTIQIVDYAKQID